MWNLGNFYWRSFVALFLSTFINKVDKKGRVSVPATFRSTLADQSYSGVVVFPSLVHPSVEGSGIDRFENLADGVDNLNPFSDEHDDFSKAIFGQTHQLPFDSEGRIILPKPLVQHSQINELAAFVGLGRTFQIWEPKKLQKYESTALKRAREARSSLKLGKKE
ncbi:MAG: division/cell wall cluster transcriptional repressor MraZ [Rhodobiaceae bacterium]|nr:division/cell wall cluster transcriptional repressor MraZ [Rhodobiaceae bacterium]